ncbi:MAG: SLC13 family permease [Pseudorhodobacter sp.]
MTPEMIMILVILAGTIVFFIHGGWRHDIVALGTLMTCVVTGLIPAEQAFTGFSNPAVITVAGVLILSRGLQVTGAVDVLARTVLPKDVGRVASLSALVALGAALSSVMNNVGAMALLMPVGIRLAPKIGLSPGQVLMPLAFGTILGGMTTLIGTPPNLIVSGFRAHALDTPFRMFDFAPVGLVVAVAGTVFLTFIGWRLVPKRAPSNAGDFDIDTYMLEITTTSPDANAIGMTLRQIETALNEADAQVVALIRNGVKMTAPHGGRRLAEGDILTLEADVKRAIEGLQALGLINIARTENPEPEGDGVILREMVVLPDSSVLSLSAIDLKLRTRYGLNLLAISRGGKASRARLRSTRFRIGDVLLLQGREEELSVFATEGRLVPLEERDLNLPSLRRAMLAGAIMVGSVLLAAFGVTSAAVAFMLGALVSVLLGTVPLRQLYTSIDWPVIVLLAALIPVAGAMQTTGTADMIARVLMETFARGDGILALAILLVATMFLSDVMNNAATAAVMSPIALQSATSLGVNPDAFLMAVAVGASCAFLTPIGHQNNTLILSPGGFRFGDYWRLGLPLELMIVGIAIPLLLIAWPL